MRSAPADRSLSTRCDAVRTRGLEVIGTLAHPGMSSPPSDIYQERREAFSGAAARARRRRDAISRGRLAVFGVGAVVVAMALSGDRGGGVAWMAAGALAAVFVVLVRYQRGIERERILLTDLARINVNAYARRNREWDALPPAEVPGDVPSSPLLRDLHFFGRGSLFQLLGTVGTPGGRRVLAGWISAPAAPAEVRARQAAVRELAARLDLRQNFEREARHASGSAAQVDRFRAWAGKGGWLEAQRWHLWAARAHPLALLVLLVGHATGHLAPIWIALIPSGAVLWLLGARRIGEELAGVEVRADELRRYSALIQLVLGESFESPRLRSIQERLHADGRGADRSIDTLSRLVALAEVRHAPLPYVVLQLATLWDTHVLFLIDRWRARTGVRVGDWIEALASLAALNFDNPAWSFPELDEAIDHWRAESLAHPLLPEAGRVANDVDLGPPGTFLLVTGSNMSGKSTLLRAIGLNIVLAHAGGPVCASAMTIPPTRLGTSFVIEDSLVDGVSYFMAELRRLKAVIDDAERCRREPSWRYLFLLDEILKGTNTGERQIAVRRILLELLGSGATGAVSTHDLALAESPGLTRRARAVHFRERFRTTEEGTRMEFDYRLLPGVATTTNALALLELVGIRGGATERG